MALQRKKTTEIDKQDVLRAKKELCEEDTKFKGNAENNLEEINSSKSDEPSSNETDDNSTENRYIAL